MKVFSAISLVNTSYAARPYLTPRNHTNAITRQKKTFAISAEIRLNELNPVGDYAKRG